MSVLHADDQIMYALSFWLYVNCTEAKFSLILTNEPRKVQIM